MEPQQIIDIAERLSESYVEGDYGWGPRKRFDESQLTPATLGFPYIRATCGTTRTVLIGEKIVFKAVTNGSSTHCNIFEWELYSIVPDWARPHFCRPLYISRNGRVIVMERLATGVTGVEIKNLKNRFREKISDAGEISRLFSDDIPINLGFKNGQIQFLDYANSYDPMKLESYEDINSVRIALRDSFPIFLTSDI